MFGPTSAATKRNALLKASAPQNRSTVGSQTRPIKIDDDDNDDYGTKVARSKRKLASGSRACSRRAAAAAARTATSKTGGPKRLKKGKSPPKANNDNLPDIAVGTNILKYFTKGWYQGTITKLPCQGNSFYHVRYDDDGDEEDMAPHEMWMAYSDWCMAYEGMDLTKVRRKLLHNYLTMVQIGVCT
jgi:hypothetical protein